MENFKRKFYTWTTGHRKLVIAVFLIVLVLSLLMEKQITVNYDMKDYLPEGSPSTVALETMRSEYDEGVPNARVMVKDVTVPQALDYKEAIEAVDGVDSVTWLDDSVNTAVPLDTVDKDLQEQYYKDGNALFRVTIDEAKILSAVPEIEEIIGTENAMDGNAVSVNAGTVGTVSEVNKLTVLAVIMVLLILVFATKSWLEPVVILASIGTGILINAGTNLMFGEISFVTDAAGSVLLLAVSLDYSVFLMHRYHEYRETIDDPRQAMIEALCRSTNSIFSSGMTTVIGFMALVLMRFKLGPDLGWASAKGIVLSLITVFVFLPALYIQFSRIIEKTHHKNLMPDFTKLGKVVAKVMIPMVCIFVLVIAPVFLASNANTYYYGASKIYNEKTEVGKDTLQIEEVFGQNDTYALMVPKGDLSKEKAMSAELQEIPEVSGVLSYVDTVGAEIPSAYLDDDVLSQLNTEDYTRMVITAGIGDEGDGTFEVIEAVKDIAEKYYPGEYLLAGSGPSNYDLMTTITADMLKVNLIAVAAVYLILLLMMRSFLLPALLVLSIETAVWINTAMPYFTGDTVFYIAYLIISTVQLGATVDYAILMTDRYRECRETMGKKDAVIETVASSVPSILVSGLALMIVGMGLGIISSHGVLSQLGVFLGRGAICSLVIVVFVLPGLLYLFDKFYINRGKGKMKKKKAMAAAVSVMMLGAAMMPQAALADTVSAKEEVIYGNLAHDGSVSEMYVVNIFEDENITDYGDYTSVKNMTSTDEIVLEDGKVTVKASETPFYYEGAMEVQELPWEIDISYSLDGKKCEAQELAGKSGALKIKMDIKEGENSFFYNNYALQITMLMDSNFCRNIEAEGATMANVGSDKQITYTVLPGNGADIVVTADVTAFEMAEISINGIKLNMDIDVDTSELESEAQRLEDGTGQLDDAAGLINDGAGTLDDGASQLQSGTENLKNGTAALKEGTTSLASGITDLSTGAEDLSEGATGLHTGITTLMGSVSGQAYKNIMKENGLDIDQLQQGNQQMTQQLTAMIPQMDPQQQALFQQVVTLLQGNSAAISGAVTYVDGVAAQLVNVEAGASELESGAVQIASGIASLKAGAQQLETAAGSVDQGASQLAGGTDELADGAQTLSEGTAELKEGTAELKEETSGIDEKIADEIEGVKEGLTGSDEVRSFISEKNTNVKSVQFVLKTEAIEIEEEPQPEPAPEEEKGFFQKLLDLFR